MPEQQAGDVLGFVLFTDQVVEKKVEQVRDAAKAAGISPEQVHDIKARNAFIRTVRQLHREGAVESGSEGVLCDKLQDAEYLLTFQFSKRYVEGQGARYDKAAVITFYKQTGYIECSVPAIKLLAEDLLVRSQEIFKAQDINALVNRVAAKVSKKIRLRDGVYFFAATQRELVAQIEKFYTVLGFTAHVLPVAANEKQRQNIFQAVVRDIRQTVNELEQETQNLKAAGATGESHGLTKRIARARIRELKTNLSQYRELARSLQVEASALLRESGAAGEALAQAVMPLDALIAAVQGGHKLQPVVADLLAASDDPPALEAIKIMQRHVAVALVDVSGTD